MPKIIVVFASEPGRRSVTFEDSTAAVNNDEELIVTRGEVEVARFKSWIYWSSDDLPQ